MNRSLLRWVFALLLGIGIGFPAFAGNHSGWDHDKDGRGHHHGHGNGGAPGPEISKNFDGFFLNQRDIGRREIWERITFMVTKESTFSTMILSSGIDDFVGSLIGRNGNSFSKSFKIGGGTTSFSALIEPGKYSLKLLGTVGEVPSGYAGVMSAVPVPEPAEWMMILAGVAMMGFVVSRRRGA